MSIEKIINRARPVVLAMSPYKSARSMVQVTDGMVFLDANECAYEPYIGADRLSRYADQQPEEMIAPLCRLYDVSSRNLIACRGADEAIDILVRTFCEDGDSVIVTPPTFPMYAHSATLQGATVHDVPLKAGDFDIDADAIIKTADDRTKIIFLCSPNNPTGTVIAQSDIEKICTARPDTLVVLDEIYIEFAERKTSIPLIDAHPNLVVLRSLSKAYAAAGVRCGVAIAHADIIALMRKVLAVYPVPQPVVAAVAKILSDKNLNRLREKQQETLRIKKDVEENLKDLDCVEKIYTTQTNFLFVKFKDAEKICKSAVENGFVLRDQSYQKNMENCVRFSIGTREEMDNLLRVFKGESLPKTVQGRTAEIRRNTKETAIAVKINLDEPGPVNIHTGIGFYDHMLEQLARHGGFSLQLECDGDLHIDAHHTVEDCAIALGQALKQALGDKRGISRFGFTAPLDEALAEAVIDLSGRAHLEFDADFPDVRIGDLPSSMIEHIFRSLSENMAATVHIKIKGADAHHMAEAAFKAFARALGQAIRKDGDAMPSTKGVL